MIAPETLAAALRVAQHGAQHAMRAAILVPASDAAPRPPDAPAWGLAAPDARQALQGDADGADVAPAGLLSEIAGAQHHRHPRA